MLDLHGNGEAILAREKKKVENLSTKYTPLPQKNNVQVSKTH